MADFKRKFGLSDIEKLKNSSLYIKCLEKDIYDGTVFPAIRCNSIEFYHKGGLLFKYANGRYKTHIKYASILKSEKLYVGEEELEQSEKIKYFESDYKRIKENCALYAGDEAKNVSALYGKYSYANKKKHKIVVLDIEISFESLSEKDEDTQDRIDLLLYSVEEKKLKFVEAKHYSNGEVWSKENTKPKISSLQIPKYNNQIIKKTEHILKSYNEYMKSVNEIFELGEKYPVPEKIEYGCGLYLFGFDSDQKEGRLKKLLLDDGSLHGIKYYMKGNPKSVLIDNLWKSVV